MKVSDIITYTMKMILKDFVGVLSEIYKRALKVKIWNIVALGQAFRKQVGFLTSQE